MSVQHGSVPLDPSDDILEKDENVKKEIQIRAQYHLENHNYHRQQLIIKNKERFIMDKAYEEFEKKISRIDPSFHHKRLDYIYLLR